MRHTFEYYKDVKVDGVAITSRRGLKGNKKYGIFEVFEIMGRKNGIYRNEQGSWMTGMLYSLDKYTYEEAMAHWQNTNLPKFKEVA